MSFSAYTAHLVAFGQFWTGAPATHYPKEWAYLPLNNGRA